MKLAKFLVVLGLVCSNAFTAGLPRLLRPIDEIGDEASRTATIRFQNLTDVRITIRETVISPGDMATFADCINPEEYPLQAQFGLPDTGGWFYMQDSKTSWTIYLTHSSCFATDDRRLISPAAPMITSPYAALTPGGQACPTSCRSESRTSGMHRSASGLSMCSPTAADRQKDCVSVGAHLDGRDSAISANG